MVILKWRVPLGWLATGPENQGDGDVRGSTPQPSVGWVEHYG